MIRQIPPFMTKIKIGQIITAIIKTKIRRISTQVIGTKMWHGIFLNNLAIRSSLSFTKLPKNIETVSIIRASTRGTFRELMLNWL